VLRTESRQLTNTFQDSHSLLRRGPLCPKGDERLRKLELNLSKETNVDASQAYLNP